MIIINISNDSDLLISHNNNNLKDLSKMVLLSEKCNDAKILIILSNRDYVSNLKKQYFNINVNTDVIAFNLEDKNDCIDGEIYISIEDVIENAKIYSKTFNDEFSRVIIHGILHLLGYNDKTKTEKKIMSALEEKYLSSFNKKLISMK